MSVIALNISDPGDSEADKQIITTLESLVNGSIDPLSAAQTIDRTIVAECHEAYDSEVRNANSDGEQNEAITPGGWLQFLWNCLGRIAMVVPSDHSGQDHIISMLQELQRMPRHKVPYFLNGQPAEKELYILTRATKYEYFEQWLWTVDQGNFTGGRQLHGNPEVASRYLNFSAFLARLLAGGVTEATRLSALISPSPFGERNIAYTKTHVDSADAARKYEPYVSAAAQWMFYAGGALFEMCEKDVLVEIGAQRWNHKLWESWKAKFEAVAVDDRFSVQTRGLASRAGEEMIRLERLGVKDTIVEKFGFIVLGDDGAEEEAEDEE